ncbi:MAG: hypothetical protein ACJ716_10795 [Marmoricola sp.]
MPRLLVPLLLAALGLTGCDAGVTVGQSPDPNHHPAGWKRVADLPLTPRSGSVVVTTPRGIVVVGGDVGDPCSPNADCARVEAARDGAILDPSTGRWRPIAPAPVDIAAYHHGVVAGGHLFALVDGALLDYDLAADRWHTLRQVSPWYDLEADGRQLVLFSGSDEGGVRPDLIYDVPTGRWSSLPPDPIGRAFDRGITATPSGLVLTAHALVPSPGGGDSPTLTLAARYDRAARSWTRLPDATDMLGARPWAWTDRRMVVVALDATDGGGDPPGDYGRRIPFGGTLDPTTGTWSRLPKPPRYLSGVWNVDAVGGPLVAAEGWIYDDETETWLKVPRPRGAPPRPGPATWVGSTVYVIGGLDDGARQAEDAYDLRVWSWTPETKPRL